MSRHSSSWLIPIIFVLWVFFVLATFFAVQKPFSIENVIAIGNVLLDLLVAIWIGLTGLGLGGWLLRFLHYSESSLVETVVLGTGLGLGGLGLLVLAFGLLGMFQPLTAYLITATVSAVAAPRLWQLFLQFRGWRPANPPPRLMLLYLVIIGILALLVALTPPTDWDGLFYHLTAPQRYIKAGQIVGGFDVPHFSFPSLMEMLFAWAMLLRSDIAAKLLHTIFGLLLAGLVYSLTRRFFGSKAAWPAVLILASMPMLGTLAGWAYNDLALAFYQLAAVYAIGNWLLVNSKWRLEIRDWRLNNRKSKIQNHHWLILSGVFAGLAMGLKYTAFVTPLVVVALILWSRFRRAEEQGSGGTARRQAQEPEQGSRGAEEQTGFPIRHSSFITHHSSLTTHYALRTTLTQLTIFSLTALLIASPWYLKNAAHTGNPVYPFLSNLFNGQFWDSFRAEWYAAAGTGIGWRPSTLLALPWLLTLGVRDANYWDGRTGPLLLLFLPLIVLYSFSNLLSRFAITRHSSLITRHSSLPPAFNLLLIYVLAHFAFWTLGVIWSRSLWQSRLLLPGLVGLVPLAGWVWVNLSQFNLPQFSLSRFVNVAVVIALALVLVDTALLTLKIDPIPYLVGLESRDQHLTRRLGAYYAAMQQINQELPNDAKIAFLWEPRSYYCQLDCRPDSILDTFPHLVYLHQSADAIAQQWRQANVSHVLIHRNGLQFMLNEQPESIDNTVLQELESQHLQELFDVAGAYQVYALK